MVSRCARRCPSCAACSPDRTELSVDEVLAASDSEALMLGGGNAAEWSGLSVFLEANRARATPQEVWVEAPAAAFDHRTIRSLVDQGVGGARVQVEAFGDRMCRLLGVAEGRPAIERVEAAGLMADARLCVRPSTFSIAGPVARSLAPREVLFEISPQPWAGPPRPVDPGAIETVLLEHWNLRFSGHRMHDVGYIPPCVAPRAWVLNPLVWRSVLSPGKEANAVLPACSDCALRLQCHWNDVRVLSANAIRAAVPVAVAPPTQLSDSLPVPASIAARRAPPPVICTEPWTSLEIPDANGAAHQCGGEWSTRPCGDAAAETLSQIWNGEGFRRARREMAGSFLSSLCNPICIHLHNQRFHEERFRIYPGSKRFVDNQLLAAEDIAERREIVRAKPLHISLAPSSYCNYDCIFCDHGRTPRRDLPESVWEELPEFLPTLRTLTILGGEPFANPRFWHLLTDFDIEAFPDVRLDVFTNGALITEHALSQVRHAPFGEITISLNSGEPEVYERLERGLAFEKVLQNIDGLIRFRSRYPFWFGITLSFIVQSANAHTLMAFGRLAHERNLYIRLVGLHVRDEELNFYRDPDEVARVLRHLDEFGAWAERVRPEWTWHVAAVRGAILDEAAKRQRLQGRTKNG